MKNQLGAPEANDIIIPQHPWKTYSLAVDYRTIFALKVLNDPAIVCRLKAKMPSRKKNIVNGQIAIRRPPHHQRAIQLAQGDVQAIGFDHDVRHIDIIEQLGAGGSIFI